MYERITIRDVVPLTGWEMSPKSKLSDDHIALRCHICDDKDYHVDVDCNKNVFHCIRCDAGGGMVELYSLACHNEELYPGTPRAKELFRMMKRDLGKDPYYQEKKHSPRKVLEKEYTKVECASDDILDKTYSTVLDFPHFKLSQKDRENLLGRGLSEEAIERNGYRSIDYKFKWIFNYPEFVKAYEETKKNDDNDKNKYRVIAGMILASFLEKKGCTLQGCPGFYKRGPYWVFHLLSGILIPTRNINGQIVCYQVRTNNPEYRYLTVSAKHQPGSVTEPFMRMHFPLGNTKLHPGSQVFLTEGALKSDVAVDLMNNEDAFFTAILGVNHVKPLPGFFDFLTSQGIHEINNALDMDKITNINVIQRGNVINKMAVKHNVKVMMLYWDKKYCERKYRELLEVAKAHQVPVSDPNGNIFLETALLTIALDNAGVKPNLSHWDSDTKGIDDFLLQTTKNSRL